DWLFVLYLAGAVITLLWYLGGYLRLRLALRRALPLSPQQAEQLHRVCSQYQLKTPRAVQVAGLPTAFVCGVLRPVLALPDTAVDDKVILHELLHLKHFDSAQSMLWCVGRAVHWCNPFLQYCFDRIGNDGEAACDQRVLEHLQGEERRDYGRILLSMANEQYPRAAGTSPLSNGGRCISRRIQAIARFKRYPQGMALVSVCILAMLLSPVLMGGKATAPDLAGSGYVDLNGPYRLREAHALALTRTSRCRSMAGALDLFAHGMFKANRTYYLMSVSPAQQLELMHAAQRGEAPLAESGPARLRVLAEHANMATEARYTVWNLTPQPDGSHSAWLCWHWQGAVQWDASATKEWIQLGWLPADLQQKQAEKRYANAMEDGVIDPDEQQNIDSLQVQAGIAWLMPVTITGGNSSYTVTAQGAGFAAVTGDYFADDLDQLVMDALAPLAVYKGKTEQGHAEATLYICATVSMQTAQSNSFWPSQPMLITATPDPGAGFDRTVQMGQARYTQFIPTDPATVKQAGMYLLTNTKATETLSGDDYADEMGGNVSGGSSSGDEWFSCTYGDDDSYFADDGSGAHRLFTGTLGQRISPLTDLSPKGAVQLPHSFEMQIYINKQQADALLLQKEG
ncbi:MAG: M56 family metallopeptidase, partial [Faecalibacterium sp.]|nr:M56 family metallopeptidase [Faecalibacterium sp.]